jgi:formiminotetrahydrofolate cyclodeaminase
MQNPETRNYRLEDFLRDLSSEDRLPGSGAAGAVALALAAACAAKAAAITLKHAPNDSRLRRAHEKLLSYIDAAIAGSDEDMQRFARFLHLRTAEATRGVIAADQKLLALISALTESLQSLDEQVRRSVSGDLAAARALTQAARTIELENISELST